MSKDKRQNFHRSQLCPGKMEWSYDLTDRFGQKTHGYVCPSCGKTFVEGAIHSLQHVARLKGE
jgi:hypothetical protein